MSTDNLQEYRCAQCHALLFKADLAAGHVEIKCSKCNFLNNFRAPPRAVALTDNMTIDFFGGVYEPSAEEHQPLSAASARANHL